MDAENPLQKENFHRTIILPGIKKKRLFVLLPGKQVYLNIDKPCDERRFITQFRFVWSNLPVQVKKKILKYWRNSDTLGCPFIELSTLWTDSQRSHAQVCENWNKISFNSETFAQMPEKACIFVIAHELAHVFLHAEGCYREKSEYGFDLFYDKNSKVIGLEFFYEKYTDKVAKSWGFDKASLNRWSKKYGEKSI